MFGFKKNDKTEEKQKISKEYTLNNIDQNVVKKYLDNFKTMLYVHFVVFNNNTQMHVYSEDTEIIGDIKTEDVKEILDMGFTSGVVFLKKTINDTTGEIEYTTGNVMCSK